MLVNQTIFAGIVVLIGAMAASSAALAYFVNVRLERPAVGVFNGRDIIVLLFFIVTLPLLYLILPPFMLTGFLVLTFTCALYLALSPLLPQRVYWPLIVGLLVANIIVTETLLGAPMGWQFYWILNSVTVLLAAMGVSNLYVQGGMRLRHVAWFALALAAYDILFLPLTLRLADSFIGRPLDPSIGFRMGPYNANIGLGDLLIYCLFMVAAYKGFGRSGLLAAFIIIPIFGAILPSLAPLVVGHFLRKTGVVVPAQIIFGPAAFITYHVLARVAPERSMAQWFKLQDVAGRQPVQAARRRTRPAAVASKAS